MSFKTKLQSYNADLHSMLDTINGLPDKYVTFPNGTEWTQSNITNYNFTCIRYTNGTWVACSEYGGDNIYYSDNGKMWNKSDDTNMLGSTTYKVYYGKNIWIAGTNMGLCYSTDGIIWTQSNVVSGHYKSIYYENGLFVAACGASGDDSVRMYHSFDGKTWSPCKDQYNRDMSRNFNSIYNANGIWVAGCSSNNGIYYSTDGINWTQSNITSIVFNCIYNDNGIWVAGSESKGIYHSTDGKTWTQSNIASGRFDCIHYANGIWIATPSVADSGRGIYYSNDGVTWTRNSTIYVKGGDIYNANGVWVIVASNGEPGAYYSIDGIVWSKSNINVSCAGVYCANGIWVLGSYNGKGLYYSVTWEVI